MLAILGGIAIVQHPAVLAAVNPLYGFNFLLGNSALGFFALGAVVLCITGAEALYADMGHFGARPIQYAWLGYVLPALLINYFGQGALLLDDPTAIENPFYLLAPDWALYPLVILATVATVIASQAVISGAFSITQQAIQLGYTPRLEVQHTSDREIGQIYLPALNWLMLAAIIALVLGFGSSSRLAAAYGIAVTGTMLITNILAIAVAVRLWQWSPLRAVLGALPFIVIDLGFFLANSVKIPDGGWFPLAFGLAIFILLTTWKRGRELLHERMAADALQLKPFIEDITTSGIGRVPGTAIFMTPAPESVPHALLHSLKHYKTLHEQVVILSVSVFDVPYVPDIDRDRSPSAGRKLLAGHRPVRLQGRTGHPGRARPVRRRRTAHRHDGCLILPRARDADPEARIGYGVLARTAVRRHVPQCQQRNCLLQDSIESRRRTGVADRAVSRSPASAGPRRRFRERQREQPFRQWSQGGIPDRRGR